MPPYDTLPPYQPPFRSDVNSQDLLWVFNGVATPVGHAEPVPRKSLFTHHLLPVRHNYEMAMEHTGTPGWYLGGIALSLMLICLFFRKKQLRLLDLLHSLVNARAMDRMLRATNMTRVSEQFLIAPIMLLPLLLIVSRRLFPTPLPDVRFLTLYVAACAVYYVRNGIVRFLGNAFLNKEATHIYLTSNYLYHLTYGLVAMAFVFFICFAGEMGVLFFHIAAGLIGILYVMRLLRGLQLILTNSKTLKLYLFYYLCSLEIVPAIVIIFVAIS